MKKRVLYQLGRDTLKSIQETFKTISASQLPFDLTAELGSVIRAAEISSGVYSISTDKEDWMPEYYVVTKDAPAISDKARSYGQEFTGKPHLRIYDQSQPGSGRYIIQVFHLPGNCSKGPSCIQSGPPRFRPKDDYHKFACCQGNSRSHCAAGPAAYTGNGHPSPVP